MPTLHFKGKSVIRTHHLTLQYHQLAPDPARSLNDQPSLSDNLIIHGDNLLALKSLLPSFSGKIKCIYIDPPYNTGNEKWVYNDAVNSPAHQEWFKRVVDREDLTRHDKWLCLMWPRLILLRDLLRDDGVIFISIDDNEVHHLRAIMDEIFGEQNFVATVIWQKIYTLKNTADYFSEMHDYIVVYAKNKEEWNINLFPREEKQNKLYSNPDNDPHGPWMSTALQARNYYSKGVYPIVTPIGKVIQGPPPGTYWRVSEEKFKELNAEGRIWWGEDGKNIPRQKRYLSEVKQGVTPGTIWFYGDVGTNSDAKAELKTIFPEQQDLFISPKPTRLIRRILQIATESNPDDIILDSFAGSGTTGQAVLALNAEDGGNRKFILIEQEDYADTLTAERVRRIIGGVPGAKDDKLKAGYGGSFTFLTLGEALAEGALLQGGQLPSYRDLARYVFFTATGEQLDETCIDESRWYLGESKQYEVYLLYKPDVAFLKNNPLNLALAESLPSLAGRPASEVKTRLVIASHKYLDDDYLRKYRLEFCQLPFAIYRFRA